MIAAAVYLNGCAAQHQVSVRGDTVALSLRAPEATRVQFAASSDQYTLHEAARSRDGNWTVAGLTNREFQYFYLVDGKLFVPDCRYRQQDDFGTTNCRHLP